MHLGKDLCTQYQNYITGFSRSKKNKIMQIKIFTIPIDAEENQTEEMNHFLRSHKIINMKSELASFGSNSCWTFCITYLLTGVSDNQNEVKRRNGKTDYKELLEPDAFERFSRFRKIRKQIAEDEAVPAYAVFTDAELAEMANLSELTKSAMQKIPNIGKKKVEKYADAFLLNTTLADETSGKLDASDSES